MTRDQNTIPYLCVVCVCAEKEYCKSRQCVQAASSILAAMDSEAEPCTDFFQYACGSWVRRNPIPKGYHRWDRVQELSGQNLFVLKTLIGNSRGFYFLFFIFFIQELYQKIDS